MSGDECDYMSDAFTTAGESKDICPGLIQTRSLKRRHNILKKKENSDRNNQEKQKPIKELERENLENGLQTPLNTDNKGYALLEKMGFKPGSGLGKEGTGRAEPVRMEIKTNREGLGVKAELQEMRSVIEKKWKESIKNAPSVDDFRSRIIDEANERQAGSDLYKSQKTCHSLDAKQGLCEPLETWFWPEKSKEDEKDKDEEDKDEEEEEDDDDEEKEDKEEIQISVQDKLEMLTLYLRRTYFYCVWCGTTFDDEKDMQEECPGPTRNDH